MTARQRNAAAAGCLLCGSTGAVAFSGLRDRLGLAAGEYTVRRCDRCRLAWLDGESAADAHGGGYYTHAADDAALRARSAVSPAAAAVLARRLGYPPARAGLASRILARVPPWRERCESLALFLPARPGGRLLDIGSGAGEFAARMRQLGWDVECAEPDAAAAAVASRAFGLKVHHGDLGALRLPAGAFDAVTMSHVIEHLPDPLATLREAARLVRPGGMLAVVTPNVQGLGCRLFGADWMHWDVPRHRFLFSCGALAEVARRAGFTPAVVRTTARAARWSWRRSAQFRRGAAAAASDPGRARGPAAVLFEAVESALQPWSEAGEECVLLAVREAA
jgi:2-polyprenyl-3-methyl-5-hydroxy-6-metoxy-1,4-benzoquinol methylase